ncbi:uncharacterized protein FSUBG_12022 [Fusarium subglutinans]|uniref:Uncharacterized protein n=1 Tax=Gibberella subglutinans TaxID=42677 RepID=A0A8H5P0U3_GIBSU|nr:uncharacterized protein FSUBG_12022 [Fusarium subglutinans]KAF5586731.1 hypothetical protein FSUBG_12022 [Fusarium subglutinans]
MKYSAIALLALAQGIVAIPSLLGQIKQSQSKVLVPDQDISYLCTETSPTLNTMISAGSYVLLKRFNAQMGGSDHLIDQFVNATLSGLKAMPLGIIATQ